jgi:hypothetical protein
LSNVELREGLEIIDGWVFCQCTSLTSIRIPSTVKKIGKGAFYSCSQVMNVELCEGLECIEWWAFHNCTSLGRITIPSTVDCIYKTAFNHCNGLAAIVFCEKIEQFVHEVSLPWWNHGLSVVSLCTYCFLAQFNIPARLEQIKVGLWKNNIHDMLRRIPTMILSNEQEFKHERENEYLESIDSLLINYEYLQHSLAVLELALWKAKMGEHLSNNASYDNVKLLCRYDSLSMTSIIIPNVLAFLVDE